MHKTKRPKKHVFSPAEVTELVALMQQSHQDTNGSITNKDTALYILDQSVEGLVVAIAEAYNSSRTPYPAIDEAKRVFSDRMSANRIMGVANARITADHIADEMQDRTRTR